MAEEFNQDSGSKTKLITDMISLMQRLSVEFSKVESSSKGIFSNLKGADSSLSGIAGGSGGNGGAGSIAASGGTYSGGFGAVGKIAGAFGSMVAGVGASFATMMPTVQQAVSSQLLTSQARFTGMQGNVNSTVQNVMGMGTSSSSSDLQQAISQGAANGVLPGLPGYNSQILPGVAQLSNLTGSFQSAMGATSSLNSAGSVNTLRRIGISVRGANGAERNPAAIFKDIYDFAVSMSGGKLNSSNIAIALQPGNGLYNLLQAASAGDPTLFNALQNAAIQFSQGGDLSKGSTTSTGQLTKALNSASSMNASQFGLTAASQTPEAAGFTEANKLLVSATNSLAKLVGSNADAAWALKQLAKGETLGGSNLGKGGAGIIGAIGGFLMRGVRVVAKDAKVMAAGAATGAVEGEVADPAGGGLPGAVLGAAVALGSQLIGNGQSTGGLGQGASAPTAPGAAPTTNSSPGAVNLVMSTAGSLQGVPYSWGGGSIGGPTRGTQQGSNTVGFDCSSFVQYVFAKVGVMLPRTTYAQINCGVAIPPTQANPGDLLFFGNATSPDHVAIYIGNNRLIQAPQTGETIGTASVDLRTVSAARRVIGGATGTAINKNLLSGTKSGTTSSGSSGSGQLMALLSSLSNLGVSGNSGGVAPSTQDLMGSTPSSAMSGGTSGGSGMGQGAIKKYYPTTSAQTGVLSENQISGVHNSYRDIIINMPAVSGKDYSMIEHAKLIKKELASIGLHAKVATT